MCVFAIVEAIKGIAYAGSSPWIAAAAVVLLLAAAAAVFVAILLGMHTRCTLHFRMKVDA